MSNKQNINDITLNTIENIADEVLFKSATTLLEDITKSIPIASIAIGLTQAYTNYKNAKEQKQLLAFIQEAENINHGFIEKFFRDKDNLELGLEVLGILDQTYLEKQAKMIGRATVLFKKQEISKQNFDKYTYIITRINNHLIYLIDELYTIKTNKEETEFEFDIENPNMEFVNFSFLEEVSSPLYPGSTQISRFKRTDSFYDFYEHIFKD